MHPDELAFLQAKAKEIRKMTLDTIGYLGVGHVGGALSIIEALTVLYYRHMRVDPTQPRWPERDWLVLSKGHAGPALYSVLADKGFFPREWLHTLNRGGTSLPSHCDRNLTPGVDMTTGSLGQGLSAAVGIALGLRLSKLPGRVYCILGDGESQEGQVWEAAMAARQFGVDNLTALLDYNKLQIDGRVCDIMNIEDVSAKWQSFGWRVYQVDGHAIEQIDAALTLARCGCGPAMIILHTVKAKGAFFAEGKVESHNMPLDYALAQEAIRRLDEEEA